MVLKGGQTYWVPMAENQAITNFQKWELAFRVYSDIYSRAHPTRSCELLQYNHIIHTISTQFIWENVYNYDKDFRLHMAWHPHRNWSIILQQAWSMRLRDRVRLSSDWVNAAGGNSSNTNRSRQKAGEICRRFNRG